MCTGLNPRRRGSYKTHVRWPWFRLSPVALYAACAGGASGVEAAEYDGRAPLNPLTTEGDPILVGFGHHPECFVLSAPSAGAEPSTKSIDCPGAAIKTLTACRSGLLYPSKRGGCVCVPASGDEATRVDCPSG